jgi:hypothetical protein
MMSQAYNAYDADSGALLKALNSETVSTNNEFGDNAIDLKDLSAQYWGSSETPNKLLSVCIQVEDFDTNGNFSRVYVYLNSTPDNISGATRQVFLSPPEVGFYHYVLDITTIQKAYPGFNYMFTQAGLGTGSTIKYGAWVAPVAAL